MRYGNSLKILLCSCLMLALAACSEIEGVDYLPLGHPADPDATAGNYERMPRSLEPELIDVKPLAKAALPAKPVVSRRPQKAKDHSMHGGGR